MWQILKDFGLLGLIGAALAAYLVNQYKQVKALKKGVQALLRAQMISDYNHYTDKGYAPLYARENFENVWIQYEALGKNGVMKDLHDKFLQLPTEPEREEK